MNFITQTPQLLEEGRFILDQFKSYFQTGVPWKTSLYFQDQTVQQFSQNLKEFFLQIQKIKTLQLQNLQSINNTLNNICFNIVNNIEVFLNLKQNYLQSIAQLLQIKLIIIQTSSSKQREFGSSNFPIAKIIIIQNNSNLTFSYIFGHSCFKLSINSIPYNIVNNFIQKKCHTWNPSMTSYDNKFNTSSLQSQPKIQFQSNIISSKQNFPNNQQFQKFSSNNSCFYQTTEQEEQEQESITQTMQIQVIPNEVEKPNFNLNIVRTNPYQINKTVCDLCCETYEENSEQQIILPCCNQIVHRYCVQTNLTNSADFFMNLKCSFCKKHLELNFLKEIIGLKQFQENVKKYILLQCAETCFNCIAQISILPEQKKQICKIKCGNCQTDICSKCRKNYHGMQFICQEIRQEIITLLQGQPLIICPFCDLIQTKDDGCNHVTCDQCKMDLCSVCSVDRRPILSHGNHFHRNGCSDYWVEKGKESITKERNRDCELCKNSPDKCCFIPTDLSTYRKEKGY